MVCSKKKTCIPDAPGTTAKTTPAAPDPTECDPGTAYEQLKALAEEDGWYALWDPTCPETTTLVESGGATFVSEIEDYFGNAPPMSPINSGDLPQLVPSAYGGFHGYDTSLNHGLEATFFSPFFTHPYFLINFAQTFEIPDFGRVMISPNPDSADWLLIRDPGDPNYEGKWTIGQIFPWLDSNADINTAKHIHGGLRNGNDSEMWIDGVLEASGALDDDDTNADLQVGQNWNGTIGPVALYIGNPTEGVKSRMFNLLKSLSGIA